MKKEKIKIPCLPECPKHKYRKGYILCGWCNRNREEALKYCLKLKKQKQ